MAKFLAKVTFGLEVIVDTEDDDFKTWLEDQDALPVELTPKQLLVLVHDYVGESLSDDSTVFGEIEDLNNIEVLPFKE